MTTSWEDARRCPECEEAGQELSRKPGTQSMRGSSIVTLECPKEHTWIVQIRPDGTIPDPVKPEDREHYFPKMPGWRKERGRDIIQNIEEDLRRQTQPGGGLIG